MKSSLQFLFVLYITINIVQGIQYQDVLDTKTQCMTKYSCSGECANYINDNYINVPSSGCQEFDAEVGFDTSGTTDITYSQYQKLSSCWEVQYYEYFGSNSAITLTLDCIWMTLPYFDETTIAFDDSNLATCKSDCLNNPDNYCTTTCQSDINNFDLTTCTWAEDSKVTDQQNNVSPYSIYTAQEYSWCIQDQSSNSVYWEAWYCYSDCYYSYYEDSYWNQDYYDEDGYYEDEYWGFDGGCNKGVDYCYYDLFMCYDECFQQLDDPYYECVDCENYFSSSSCQDFVDQMLNIDDFGEEISQKFGQSATDCFKNAANQASGQDQQLLKCYAGCNDQIEYDSGSSSIIMFSLCLLGLVFILV